MAPPAPSHARQRGLIPNRSRGWRVIKQARTRLYMASAALLDRLVVSPQ